MKLIWLALVTAFLAGCGAGGGSAAGTTVEPKAALVELGIQGGAPATVVYSVELTLHLPAGVTLAADPVTGMVFEGVLHPVDSAALAGARYLPATSDAQATLKINIADPGGFAVGGLATLNCRVAPGAAVSSAGFTLDGFSARDANGAAMPGITPYFAVRPQ